MLLIRSSMRAELWVNRLPHAFHCNVFFSNARSWGKTHSTGLKKAHTHLIKLPVFLSGFKEVFSKWSHDSGAQENRPAIQSELQSRHGRTSDTYRNVSEKLTGVPGATLSAPSEKRREVFPTAKRDLMVKLCPLPPAGTT